MSAYFENPLPFDPAFDPDPAGAPPPPASLDSVVAERLGLVVEQLAGIDGPTIIMGFPSGLPRRSRQAIGIEVEERGDESLVDLLMGVWFPSHWRAVAVAGSCRWFSTDGRDDSGEGRVAVALDQVGRFATAVVSEGKSFTTGEATGRVLDLMRLGFGLDTPPPIGTPAEFLQVVWLDRVIDRASWDISVDWLALEALQPAFGPAATWVDVHQAAIAGEIDIPGCSTELAQWFDVGAFSRCAPELLPTDRDLMSTAVDLLPPVLVGLVCDRLCNER